MTISSTGTRFSYSGNGSTTAFSFPRQFFADADLDVYLVDNVSGVAVLQVLNTHYTVAGAGSPSGGTVNMVAAPATGATLVILRDTPLTQSLDLDNVSSFPMASIEAAFDRAMMAIDELTTKVSRAIMYPLWGLATSFDWTMPAPVANKVLGVNAAGTALEMRGPQAWSSGSGAPAGGLGVVGDYYLDTASGDVYLKTGVSTWTLQLNMRGPQGVPGSMTGPGVSAVGNIPTFNSLLGNLLQDSGIPLVAIAGTRFITSAGGTTTLTAADPRLIVVTGTQNQTIVLPDVTTLGLGRSFEIDNQSTGTVTVQSSGLNTIGTAQTGDTNAVYRCILVTGTTAASWSQRNTGSGSSRTGSGALVFGTQPSLTQLSLVSSNGLTAGTNAQGQGALSNNVSIITTAANNPSGVTLPSIGVATNCRLMVVVNKGANPVNVYPPTGGQIDALGTNAAIQLPVGGVMFFVNGSTTQWYSSVNFLQSLAMATGALPAGTSIPSPNITYSTTTGITAGTNAQGQGALTSDLNVIGTAAANPSGVTLPTATVGRVVTVVNKGANPIAVFPASGAAIDGLAANASILVPVGGIITFEASSTTQWYSTATVDTPYGLTSRMGSGGCSINWWGDVATANWTSSQGNFALTFFNDNATGDLGTGTRSGNGATFYPKVKFATNGTITAAGGVLAMGPSGYVTGGGGAVSQSTSKSTGVTLNKPAGQITMNAAALAANSAAIFTLTCSAIGVNDGVVITIQSPTQKYTGICVGVAAGSCDIRVNNITAGSLSEAVVVNYQVKKGANS